MIGLRLIGTLLLSLGLLAGCGGSSQPPLPSLGEEGSVDVDAVYKLGADDQLRVTVFRHEDLSGEFRLDGEGFFSLPLVGEVQGGGKTVRELETNIVEAFQEGGYLINPRVAIEVLNYRPFYIVGEVNNQGGFPYVNGMTMETAVGLAGGFTYRANQSSFTLRRGGSKGQKFSISPTTQVLPGDHITVHERFL